MKDNLISRRKFHKKSVEFSRRDFIKKVGNGTALAVGGGGFSFRQFRKESDKDAARKAAMNSFRKGLKVYEYKNFHKSFPNGKKDVPGVLDKWAEAGLDFLITTGKLLHRGEVLYHRTEHPIAEGANGWDPLEVLNAETKKRGMKLYTWIPAFLGATSKFARAHPEYIACNKEGDNKGNFLCPARDEVQECAFSFFEEVMKNYDIAGIHLDFIRYLEDYCWCDYCKRVFKRETGIEMEAMKTGSAEWARWVTSRVHNINKFVKRVYDASVKYDKEVSAGVYPEFPDCLISIAQDYMTWIDEGWVDYVIPMNYSNNWDTWERRVKKEKTAIDEKIPVIVSISRTPVWEVDALSPEEIYDRGKFLRTNGYQGVCYFSSASLTDEDYRLIKKV